MACSWRWVAFGREYNVGRVVVDTSEISTFRLARALAIVLGVLLSVVLQHS